MIERAVGGDSEIARIDEEDIRLTTGFADIFTAILLVFGGSLLFALSMGAGGLVIIVAAFLLAKPLVEVRRFAACGNVLAVGTSLGSYALFGDVLGLWAAIPAALVSYAFWKIRRVPLALALVWAAGALLIAGTGVFDSIGGGGGDAAARVLAAGLLLFAGGMIYDNRDRLRRSRLTDVAFWLHLGAAPLIVQGLFITLGAGGVGYFDRVAPGAVFAIFAVLTVISLLIDRRPLLASSFLYLVAAVYQLLRARTGQDQFGVPELTPLMAPAMIGVLLLFLAAGWSPLRRVLLRAVPDALARYLPPAAPRRPAVGEPANETAAPSPVAAEDMTPAEAEPVRLVLGFNDFFVALGAGSLFVGSIFVGVALMATLPGGIPDLSGSTARDAEIAMLDRGVGLWWIAVALPAAAMWAVAEYFVRIRRMAWPAITSAYCFSFAAAMLAVYAMGALWYASRRDEILAGVFARSNPSVSPGVAMALVIGACVLAALANLAFWRRHRIPVSFALACASLVPLAFIDMLATMLGGAAPQLPDHSAAVRLILAGLAAWAVAFAWDRSDRARETTRSDTAFWMHLLAGLLVLPAAFTLLPETVPGQMAALLGFAAIVALAVVTDRRAPVVVALPFAARALATLTGSASVILTLVILGLLLALVLRWDQARGWLLGRIARSAG